MERNSTEAHHHTISFISLLLLLVVILTIITHNTHHVAASSSSSNSSTDHRTTTTCSKPIESESSCNEDPKAMLVEYSDGDDEISRRFLEQRRYISPGALRKDQPVCNGGGPGEPYSRSCLPEPSNTYNRGCSRYYRCRDDA